MSPKLAIILTVSVVGIILILSVIPFVQIGAGERGVVMNYGQVQDTIMDEGLHWKTPFVQSVKKVNVRVQKAEVVASAASRDLQTVTVKVAVNYHLRADRVNKIWQEIGDDKQVVDGVLNPNVSEVVKAATAQKTAEELLTKRAALKTTIDTGLTERMKPYYVVVDDVSIVDIDFSPEFNQAIEAKAKAEQEALKAQKDLQRIEFEADQAVVRAQAEADSTKVKAVAEAESIRIKGEALRSNPELVDLKYAERWDGKLPVNMYGGGAVPFINVK